MLVEREGWRAEPDTFLRTLHHPEVDSLKPGIILISFNLCSDIYSVSKTWVAEASGLGAT
jgi:hypothetical protein